jgi:hypothetical protein
VRRTWEGAEEERKFERERQHDLVRRKLPGREQQPRVDEREQRDDEQVDAHERQQQAEQRERAVRAQGGVEVADQRHVLRLRQPTRQLRGSGAGRARARAAVGRGERGADADVRARARRRARTWTGSNGGALSVSTLANVAVIGSTTVARVERTTAGSEAAWPMPQQESERASQPVNE